MEFIFCPLPRNTLIAKIYTLSMLGCKAFQQRLLTLAIDVNWWLHFFLAYVIDQMIISNSSTLSKLSVTL
jgi:hypothetical protein